MDGLGIDLLARHGQLGADSLELGAQSCCFAGRRFTRDVGRGEVASQRGGLRVAQLGVRLGGRDLLAQLGQQLGVRLSGRDLLAQLGQLLRSLAQGAALLLERGSQAVELAAQLGQRRLELNVARRTGLQLGSGVRERRADLDGVGGALLELGLERRDRVGQQRVGRRLRSWPAPERVEGFRDAAWTARRARAAAAPGSPRCRAKVRPAPPRGARPRSGS